MVSVCYEFFFSLPFDSKQQLTASWNLPWRWEGGSVSCMELLVFCTFRTLIVATVSHKVYGQKIFQIANARHLNCESALRLTVMARKRIAARRWLMNNYKCLLLWDLPSPRSMFHSRSDIKTSYSTKKSMDMSKSRGPLKPTTISGSGGKFVVDLWLLFNCLHLTHWSLLISYALSITATSSRKGTMMENCFQSARPCSRALKGGIGLCVVAKRAATRVQSIIGITARMAVWWCKGRMMGKWNGPANDKLRRNRLAGLHLMSRKAEGKHVFLFWCWGVLRSAHCS